MRGVVGHRVGGRMRGAGLAFAGTLILHGAVGIAIVAAPAGVVHRGPPVYKVDLVAAPAPEPKARKAPQTVERPAERAVPIKKPKPRRTSVAKTPPPPTPEPAVKREPAPRSTPKVAPAPGEKPSTGSDVATVKTEGVAFPFPEYLRNIVAQIRRRWHRPTDRTALHAEVMFLIHRDGTITNLQFLHRSGSFAFDLEAQGAIEAAGNSDAFGPLPDGFEADVLPVSFFFNPQGTP